MRSPNKTCSQIIYHSGPDGYPDTDNPILCFNPAIRPAIKWKGVKGWRWYCVKHHPDLEPTRNPQVEFRATAPPKGGDIL
jgi:hypothetical protein